MPERIHVTHVGAPDPEKRNSPIIEELDEEAGGLGLEMGEAPVCYFNDTAFADHSEVCSGDERLRCARGSWLRVGSCDPDNP